MENELAAPISGTIKTIYVKEGASVEKGDLIMKISLKQIRNLVEILTKKLIIEKNQSHKNQLISFFMVV